MQSTSFTPVSPAGAADRAARNPNELQRAFDTAFSDTSSLYTPDGKLVDPSVIAAEMRPDLDALTHRLREQSQQGHTH